VMDYLTEWRNQLVKNVKGIFNGEENAKSSLRGNILAFCLCLDRYDSDDTDSNGFEYPVSGDKKQEIILKCISKECACVGKGAISSEICEEGCENRFICYTGCLDRRSKLGFILTTIKDEIRDYEKRVVHSKDIDRHTREYNKRIQSKIKKLNKKLGT
jgi:hypothetical protein